MGNNPYQIPGEVNSMAKNNSQFKFEIEYCDSWGGRPEANFCYKLLKTVYPKSSYDVYSPGYTGNLIVWINRVEVYNKKKGHGLIQSGSAVKFLNRVNEFIERAKLWNEEKPIGKETLMKGLGQIKEPRSWNCGWISWYAGGY